MKFPLPETVFPRVQLTSEQRAQYEQLSERVLAETLDEYDAFNQQHKRQLSKLQWKPIKKRENITVYSERCVRSEPSRATTSSSTKPSSAQVRSSESTSTAPTAHDFTASGSAYDFTASGSAYDFTASGSGYDFTASGRSNLAISSSIAEQSPSASISSPSSSCASTPRTTVTGLAGSSSSSDRRLPQLLAVGTVVGNVEDMVYGMSSPTPAYAMVKSAYTRDEILDAKVLHEITGPTPDDPLRFLGLKWLVKGHSNAIGAVVRPRDLVYIESMGVRTRANGSKVGYFVMHSVELRECRPLAELSIVRARISSCFLFKSTNNGTVDVYMKSFVQLNGNVTNSLAIKTAANSLICVWRAMLAAQNRKLGWQVHKQQQQRNQSIVLGGKEALTACFTCRKDSSLFSKMAHCRICAAPQCSKCRDQRELTLPNSRPTSRGKLVSKVTVDLCRACVLEFRFRDTLELARQEILAGMYGSMPETASSTTVTATQTRPVAALEKPSQLSAPVVALSVASPVPRERESVVLPAPVIKQVSLDDIGANFVLGASDSVPSAHGSASKATSQRGPRTISIDTVSSSNLSADDLSELVDMLALPSSTKSDVTALSTPESSASSALLSRKKTLESGDDSSEAHAFERKDSVIELERDDGEWTHSSSGSTAAPSSSASSTMSEQDFYSRITELHLAAESVYQFAKRTTETVMISSSLAMPPSLLTSLAIDEE